jgi:hypothetical protein
VGSGYWLKAVTVADSVSLPGSPLGPFRLRGLGCEYLIRYFPEVAYDRSSIERFEQEVIPALS